MMMMIMMMMMVMDGDLLVVGAGPRDTPIMLKAISQRIRIGADVDDLWQTVQPGPFSENQAQ